jgi:hypothetical protein
MPESKTLRTFLRRFEVLIGFLIGSFTAVSSVSCYLKTNAYMDGCTTMRDDDVQLPSPPGSPRLGKPLKAWYVGRSSPQSPMAVTLHLRT